MGNPGNPATTIQASIFFSQQKLKQIFSARTGAFSPHAISSSRAIE
jgi:hypothetical protein